MASLCPICENAANRFCSGCRIVSYCSADHQKKHWKVHKKDCRVYAVEKNEIYGRYLVAAKDLSPGAVIMTKKALVVGPRQDTRPICLACYKFVDGSYRCSTCSFPMCNKICEKAPVHVINECKIFARDKEIVEISNCDENHPAYECIFTLRCLMLKANEEKNWEELQKLECHNEIRKDLVECWQRNEKNTVKRLREKYGMKEFSDDVIHSVLGYAAVNTFEIKSNESDICGLFPEVSLMAHECVSNTHHSINENHQITIRATVAIKKGDLITTTYAPTMDGTLERRKFIKESKFFDCICKRCSDASELETFYSGVKCTGINCPGFLLPRFPLDPQSVWICSEKNCPSSLPPDKIEEIVENVRLEVIEARISARNNNTNLVAAFERILEAKSGKVLHPNHFSIISIIRSLTEFYGRSEGFLLSELSSDLLQRKESLCRRLLKVLDIIEPGMSRIRGLTKYELHAPLYLLAQQQFLSQKIGEGELKLKLNEVINLLQESCRILSFDPCGSREGEVANSIPQSIEGVKGIRDYFCT